MSCLVVLVDLFVAMYVYGIAVTVFLREPQPLPDDFIPPPPQAASACGDVDDVVHGDLNSTPST